MAEEGEEEPLPPCVWEGELDEGYPVGAVRPPSPRVSLARRARVELIDERIPAFGCCDARVVVAASSIRAPRARPSRSIR